MTPAEKLGKDVASALPPAPGAERRARQRAALLAMDWDRRRRVQRAAWLVPIAAVAVTLGLLVLKVRHAPTGMTEIAGDAALGEGRWMRVSEDGPTTLRFGDGTRLELERGSTGRLGRASASETRLTLENGGLHAWVQPAKLTGRSWMFEAGPYDVHIVGTELTVIWSAENSRLIVDVAHGRVHVQGGMLEGDGVSLGAGDHLDVDAKRVELRRANASVSRDATPPRVASPAGPLAPKVDSRAMQAAPTPSVKSSTRNAESDGADEWKALARAGNYSDALKAAERAGFDDLIERLPATDLALLADAARLSGDSEKARRALGTLRRRFPGNDAASMAAFRLGRLALGERDYAEAVRWFRVYLAEAPSGNLADEAMGRLIEAQSRAGDRSGAQASARDYLKRFPHGAYESLARGIARGDKLEP